MNQDIHVDIDLSNFGDEETVDLEAPTDIVLVCDDEGGPVQTARAQS